MTTLAPDHLEDLRRSGLTDETIAACGFQAVRPHDLKLQGVESAYRIPYFGLDRNQNCFCRLKLFPPVTHKDGKTQKYHQEAKSDSELYFPPMIDWESVAADPTQSVTIVEGEKKAAALAQHGIPAIGIAGVWCWRQKLDTGERLTIPTIDQIVWAGRIVEAAPDSDVWRIEKLDALCGFYALARQVLSRSAFPRFVRLRDAQGLTKQGADDFAVKHTYTFTQEWEGLERIAWDDKKLKPCASWFQTWTEKQATQEALHEQTREELSFEEATGLYVVCSQKHHATFTFDRLEDQRGTIRAEVTVTVGRTTLLDAVDVNLKSAIGQGKLAKDLRSLASTIPWKVLLQRACALVLKRSREGEPSVRLDRHGTVEPLTYTINPLIFKGKTTVLYATGGMGKSTLGLFLGLCTSVGANIGPFRPLQGNVLYLDYEDDKDVHQRRVHAIQAQHPELREGAVSYQRLVEPLAKLTHQLVRKVRNEQIALVVVDSLLAATGGDSSAEATTKLFIALRALGVSCLLIGHVPKTLQEGQEHQTIYGSVFNSNFSRSVWEVQKQQDVGTDGMILGIFHRKSNLSRLHPPIGLKASQDQDGTRIHFESFDLAEAEELGKGLPVAARIRTFLERDGNPYAAKEIAQELDIKLSVVKFTLSKHRKMKWQMIGEGRNAKWCVLAEGQKRRPNDR